MNSMMQPVREIQGKLSDYWLGISVRERQLLSAAGVLLMIWIAYFGVIRPVQDSVYTAEQRLISHQKQYDQVVKTAEKIALLQASVPVSATTNRSQPLDVLVNRAASQTGLTITGLNRQQDSLQVRMNPSGFGKLIQWMTLLEAQGVSVSSLQIARTEKPGMVEIQQLRVEREMP